MHTNTHQDFGRSAPAQRGMALALATLIFGAVGLTAGLARADDAEPPRPRQGYYVAAGGAGFVNLSREQGELGGPILGGGGSLRLGELLTPKLGLGIALDGGGGKGDDTSTLGGLSFDAHYLVHDMMALHAGVGLGISSLADAADDEAESRGGLGTYYTLGASYDWFLTDRGQSGGWSLSPLVQLRLADAGEVKSGLFYVGVQVSFWSGRDKSRLVLDEAAAYGRE